MAYVRQFGEPSAFLVCPKTAGTALMSAEGAAAVLSDALPQLGRPLQPKVIVYLELSGATATTTVDVAVVIVDPVEGDIYLPTQTLNVVEATGATPEFCELGIFDIHHAKNIKVALLTTIATATASVKYAFSQ